MRSRCPNRVPAKCGFKWMVAAFADRTYRCGAAGPGFTTRSSPARRDMRDGGGLIWSGRRSMASGPESGLHFLSNRAYAEYDHRPGRSAWCAFLQLPKYSRARRSGCAMNIFRRCDIEPEQTVAVVGIGFLGALLIQLAVAAGAQVLAISRRPFALHVARRYGAAEAFASSDPTAVIARVMERTDGSGCPCVIEAAGEQETLDLASELVGVRGRLVIAGYHQDAPRRVNMQLWNWRGIDVINAHERDPRRYVEGMKAAAERVAQGALETESLYTHGFPLENISAAFAALDERPEGFLKAWIQPRPNQASVQE